MAWTETFDDLTNWTDAGGSALPGYYTVVSDFAYTGSNSCRVQATTAAGNYVRRLDGGGGEWQRDVDYWVASDVYIPDMDDFSSMAVPCPGIAISASSASGLSHLGNVVYSPASGIAYFGGGASYDVWQGNLYIRAGEWNEFRIRFRVRSADGVLEKEVIVNGISFGTRDTGFTGRDINGVIFGHSGGLASDFRVDNIRYSVGSDPGSSDASFDDCGVAVDSEVDIGNWIVWDPDADTNDIESSPDEPYWLDESIKVYNKWAEEWAAIYPVASQSGVPSITYSMKYQFMIPDLSVFDGIADGYFISQMGYAVQGIDPAPEWDQNLACVGVIHSSPGVTGWYVAAAFVTAPDPIEEGVWYEVVYRARLQEDNFYEEFWLDGESFGFRDISPWSAATSGAFGVLTQGSNQSLDVGGAEYDGFWYIDGLVYSPCWNLAPGDPTNPAPAAVSMPFVMSY